MNTKGRATAGPARRPSRFERAFGVPQAAGFFLILVSAASAGLFLERGSDVLHLAIVPTMVGVALGWWAMRRGSGWALAFALGWLVFLVALFWLEGLPKIDSPAGRLFGLALVLGAGATLLVVGLGWSRLFSPAKASLFVLSVSAAWLVGEGYTEWRSRREPAPTTAAGAASTAADPVTPLLAQTQILWVGSPNRMHKDMGPTCGPNGWLKNLFPDNPMGYFDPEPVYGALDLRMFAALVYPEQARLEPTKDRAGIRKLNIEAPGKNPLEVVVAYAPIPVVQGKEYLLTFQARAPRARTLGVSVVGPHDLAGNVNVDPAAVLGLAGEAKLDNVLRGFAIRGVATRTEPLAALYLHAGGDATPVEFGDVRFAPASQLDHGYLDMRGWELHQEPGCAATLSLPATLKGTARCAVQKTDGGPDWHIHFQQDAIAAKKGDPLCLFFRARAPRPRKLGFAVTQSAVPFAAVGPTGTVSLDTDWRSFGFLREAELDDPNARVIFNVGGAEGEIELADVQLLCRGAIPPEPPARYSVTYQINSLGFREREPTPTPPPDTDRVICLGDSFTFGVGVHQADTYARQLEGILNARPGRRREVLSFGMFGYDTIEERQSYAVARRYHPKLVLLAMVNNDNMNARVENAFLAAEKEREKRNLFRNLAPLNPGLYRQAMDFSVCLPEIRKIQEACRADGARLAIFFFCTGEDERWQKLIATVTDGLRGWGIPLLDLRPAFRDMHHHLLIVHQLDHHPSALAQRIAAEHLARFIESEHLLSGPPAATGR